MLKISYSVNGEYLIKSAFLPLSGGNVYLVTGIENTGYVLLGGLIAKLFPIDERLEWPQLQALIKNYTGELIIEDGSLPESASYVGVDPDRHLLFSRVEEEFISQGIEASEFLEILSKFGLDKDFLDSQISNLSGGEKMRVALSIAFSSHYSCYVLHGVIPWLDKRGRELLIKQIKNAKKNGSDVILFDHETDSFKGIIDEVFEFDGITIRKLNAKPFSDHTIKNPELEKSIQILTQNFINKNPKKKTLEFKNVSLLKHPYSDRIRTQHLLNKISFSLTEQNIYFLLGDNGAGKSTIAQIAVRINNPDSGDVFFSGKPIKKYSREELIQLICYVGQFPEHQITFSTFGEYKKKIEASNNTLVLTLMENYLKLSDKFPVSLFSPLQKKLICLISFFSPETKLIILDEPTWGIDRHDRLKILNVLKEISDQLNFSLLIISHDITFVDFFEPSILWIRNGELINFESYKSFRLTDIVKDSFDIPVKFNSGE